MTKLIEKYYVRRRFDDYKVGEEFVPNGHPNDEFIIEYYCDIEYLEAPKNGVCPGCGKTFKRLDMHKCKGG